jgi:hypothetical protein
MTDDQVQGFIRGRFKELVDFYDKRSASSKRWHRIFAGYIIIISSIIPVSVATGILEKHKIVGGLASATIVAVTAWTAHAQYHENWLRYRRAWDSLKREFSLFAAGAGPYADTDRANCLFVERVEALADSEGRDWETMNSQSAGSKSPTKVAGGC